MKFWHLGIAVVVVALMAAAVRAEPYRTLVGICGVPVILILLYTTFLRAFYHKSRPATPVDNPGRAGPLRTLGLLAGVAALGLLALFLTLVGPAAIYGLLGRILEWTDRFRG